MKKLKKLVSVGAAAMVGLNALRHHRKDDKARRMELASHYLTLCSSLITAGVAVWELRQHHRVNA